jgi:hypothetical protein
VGAGLRGGSGDRVGGQAAILANDQQAAEQLAGFG